VREPAPDPNDLRDLEQVRQISLVEQLVDLLPSRVGSPLSIKGLREDLAVDHKTVERWLTILENLYLCFRIVDFVVLRGRAPLFAVECRSGDRAVSPAIRHFAARTAIPRFFQVHLGERHFTERAGARRCPDPHRHWAWETHRRS
jgi:hypothetical protein